MHLDADPDASERRRLQHIVERLDAIERELDDVAERKRVLSKREKALAENRRALINAARDPQLLLGFDEGDSYLGALDDDEVVLLERDAAGNVSARVDPPAVDFDEAVDESLRKAAKASSRPKTSKRRTKPATKTKARAKAKAKVQGIDPGLVRWPDAAKGGEV